MLRGEEPKKPFFQPGLVGSFVTNDFDEMAALPAQWEQQYSQLGYGRFTGKMFLAQTSMMQAASASWSPGIMIRGTLPPGSTLLAMPLHREGSLIQRGIEIGDSKMAVLHHGEEVDFRATKPCEFFMIAAERTRVEKHAQAILGRPLNELRRDQLVVVADPAKARDRLSQTARSMQKRLLHDASPLLKASTAEAFESELIDQMLCRLHAPEIVVNNSYRQTLAWKVEEYLRAHVRSPMSIYHLCREVGAAERTLHLAFREVFGTTPKAYLKMLRLNGVRRDLKQAGQHATVTDIAARWDFLHFGWFSHDFGQMFGMSPSAALHGGQLQ